MAVVWPRLSERLRGVRRVLRLDATRVGRKRGERRLGVVLSRVLHDPEGGPVSPGSGHPHESRCRARRAFGGVLGYQTGGLRGREWAVWRRSGESESRREAG